ncbi:N-glycosylase/DNA lyase [Desulfothermus okinawensis JCM 13304]
MDKLRGVYLEIKKQIKERLSEFKNIYISGSDEDILYELLFCLLTPQSKAKTCWSSIENLKKIDIIYKPSYETILEKLNGVRFKYKKAKYIEEAIKKFSQDHKIVIKKTLDKIGTPREIRTYLVKEIKGLGMKEASHFLRNIGKGDDLCILDRHILKNLKKYRVIEDIPRTMSNKKYIEIEEKMKEFSKKITIPLDHLDLVLWYMEAGEVFK